MLPSYPPVISILMFKTWLCSAVILRKRVQYNRAQGDNPLEPHEISSLASQHTCVQGVSGRDGWKFAWSHFLLSSLADWNHKGCFLHYNSPAFASLSLDPSFSEAQIWGASHIHVLGFQISPNVQCFSVKTLRVGWSAEIKERKGINHQRSKVELQLLTPFFL